MPELEAVGSIPLAIAAVVLLLASAMALGSLVVRPGIFPHWRPVDACLVRLAVGVNLLGVLGVTIGQTGLFSQGRSIWLLAGLSLMCVTLQVSTLRRGGNSIRSPRRLSLAGLMAVLIAAITLGPALCYPTTWDELVYHETLPKRWLSDGWPAFYWDLPYSGFPSFGEILFWLVAPVESVITPRLFVWVCWILGLACLYRLLCHRLKATMATFLTMAFTLNDTVLLISAYCYVESILLLDMAALLLTLSLRGGRGDSGRKWDQAIVLGTLAGGAAAVKLTGSAVLVVPVIWYAGQYCLNRAKRQLPIGPMLLCAIVALSVALPFYTRTWMASGNPFYPYWSNWFSYDATRLEVSRYHHLIGSHKFGNQGISGFFGGPLLLAARAERFDGEFGLQKLVFLVLAIIAVAATRRRRFQLIVWWPLSLALWLYLFWYSTSQQARFAVPYLFALVLLAGIGIQLLDRRWRWLVKLAIATALVCSIPWHRFDYYSGSWLTVVGRLSRAEYVNYGTRGKYLPFIQAIHETTSPNAKLLLLFEHRVFYLSRRLVIGTPLFQEGPFSPPDRFADAASIIRVLRQNEITHVAAAKVNPGPDEAPGWAERQQPFLRALEQCLRERRLVPRWESEQYVLLEVVK